MSSCFFSSRLRMRISLMSESRKQRSTALPNEPVPPVISNILSLNTDMLWLYVFVAPTRRDNEPPRGVFVCKDSENRHNKRPGA